MLKRTRSALAAALLMAAVPTLPLLGQAPLSSANAACTRAPAWKSAPTEFGLSLSASSRSSMGDDLKLEESRFGTRVGAVRTFTNGVPTDANYWSKRASWFGNRYIVESLKVSPKEINTGKHDAALRAYFKAAPTTMPIFFALHHEPEDEVKAGKFTAAEFRTAWKRVIDISAEFCKPNLYPTLILMGWTADPASKLNWKDYYAGPEYVSVLGWDPYNGAHGDATSYRDPSVLFTNVANASAAAGKPWGIAETGTARIPGDSAGTGRAAWLTKMGDWTSAKQAVFVTYFQSTNNGDFELRDQPGITAWRGVMN